MNNTRAPSQVLSSVPAPRARSESMSPNARASWIYQHSCLGLVFTHPRKNINIYYEHKIITGLIIMIDNSKNRDEKEEGKPLPPSYEPGVIEVIFKDEAKIRSVEIPPESKKRWNLISKTNIELKALDDLLARIECSMVSRIFTNSKEDEYDELHRKAMETQAKEKRPPVPNLNNFFSICFPPTEDPVEIAKMFEELPMVEKAYPVPTAVPPDQSHFEKEHPRRLTLAEVERIRSLSELERAGIQVVRACRFQRIAVGPCAGSTPLDEPLVGIQDTLYTVDPARGLENQWYIYRCNADSAWALACGEGVVVADIDWGYRTTHEDLASNLDMSHAYNSYDGSNNVSAVDPIRGSSVWHGTAVVGLAGAEDNNKGMIGFAYGCDLWPIQGNYGTGSPIGGNSWAHAIDWVRAQQTSARKVIILEVQTGSWGNIEMVPSVNAAIVAAIADEVVVCVAAGNGNRDAGLDDSQPISQPIPFTGSIVVGATMYAPTTNPRASFLPTWASNWGPRVDVAAPGDWYHDLTCSDIADDAYRNSFGGTSGATPKVAGTVALMLQCNPNLTPAEVRDIIMNTASPTVVTDPGKPVGGFLNTYEAVKEACRRADPCGDSLIVDTCRRLRVVGELDIARIGQACLKSNILVAPCRLSLIADGPCIRDRIVIGPCCTRELIAGDPFWRYEEFESWPKAYENLRNEALKHFKRLTRKY